MQIIADSCATNAGSSFYITRRGSLPPTPDEWQRCDFGSMNGLNIHWQVNPSDLAISPLGIAGLTAHSPIVEATDWKIHPDGSVELIAQAANVTITSLWSRSAPI